ncbi:phosphoglycolate phosphatase-like HAD superfamily hydrolase [Pedobacter cryoconitis]|uniref:phosphoglycolate phosphatase n=1 Tax=Pedobacter cryoconitis TaxID=188932 RepID=A0A7W9DZ57_9SPHI|nr:HAD hydrolase-like protein [Pedobacter cryoconitis]MBB5635200.1 phosphoglycolate phosphatase-like HAD superfamily hydrolase [Pedobacter cryoconitis]
MLSKYKVLLWDFDGVIMDSMPIRSKGFELVLAKYPKEQVDELMAFHEANGGLSRYVKFRYFFEEIRKEPVTEEQVLVLAAKFSEIMLSLLMDKGLLIQDSVEFIKNNQENFQMHIVSGSDGKELKIINESVGLSGYFKTINGSPTPKKQLVEDVLAAYQYDKKDVILIGDSINDLDAASFNDISFAGYNNTELKRVSENYIEQFTCNPDQ